MKTRRLMNESTAISEHRASVVVDARLLGGLAENTRHTVPPTPHVSLIETPFPCLPCCVCSRRQLTLRWRPKGACILYGSSSGKCPRLMPYVDVANQHLNVEWSNIWVLIASLGISSCPTSRNVCCCPGKNNPSADCCGRQHLRSFYLHFKCWLSKNWRLKWFVGLLSADAFT